MIIGLDLQLAIQPKVQVLHSPGTLGPKEALHRQVSALGWTQPQVDFGQGAELQSQLHNQPSLAHCLKPQVEAPW